MAEPAATVLPLLGLIVACLLTWFLGGAAIVLWHGNNVREKVVSAMCVAILGEVWFMLISLTFGGSNG